MSRGDLRLVVAFWFKDRVPAKDFLSSWGNDFSGGNALEQLNFLTRAATVGEGADSTGRFVLEFVQHIHQALVSNAVLKPFARGRIGLVFEICDME